MRPGVDWSTTDARRRTLALFLLEELVVRVRENASPRFRALTPGTPALFEEIDRAAEGLAPPAA